MKKYQYFILLLFIISCKKETVVPVVPIKESPVVVVPPVVIPTQPYTITTTTISDLNVPGLTNDIVSKGVNFAIPGVILYQKDNIEHLIIPPTLFYTNPLIPTLHLTKMGDKWVYENSYAEASMGCARNYTCIDTLKQNWVFSDSGPELNNQPWPFGHLVLMKTEGNKVSFSNISTVKSYYHSVSSGDINNDGLIDVVGLHMGTKGDNYLGLHSYIQNANGTFTENRDMFDPLDFYGSRAGGSVLIQDLYGDSRPEIVRGDYGFNPTFQKPSDRYSINIFSYNSTFKKYKLDKDPGAMGIFKTEDRGSTSIKAADFNKDGNIDLAIATEGTNYNGIEIWNGDGNGNFAPSNNRLDYTFDQLQFREFDVIDFDKDGYPDIILHGWAGKLLNTGNSLNINKLFWKNNSGVMGSYDKPLEIPKLTSAYVKVFNINNKLRFMAINGNLDGTITINDILIN